MTTTLTNINFMSQNQYVSLAEKNDNELYAVDVTDKFVTTDTKQEINAVKTISTSGNSPRLNIKTTDCKMSTTPASNSMVGIQYVGSDNVRVGVVESARYSNGGAATYLSVHNQQGTNKEIGVYCDVDGNFWAQAPAGGTKNGTIITNAGQGRGDTNGYFRLGNGLIIQWSRSSNSESITFPQPFADTNYTLLTGGQWTTSHSWQPIGWSEGTTTGFKLEKTNAATAYWCAIGLSA